MSSDIASTSAASTRTDGGAKRASLKNAAAGGAGGAGATEGGALAQPATAAQASERVSDRSVDRLTRPILAPARVGGERRHRRRRTATLLNDYKLLQPLSRMEGNS
jgi:hypothetical protein